MAELTPAPDDSTVTITVPTPPEIIKTPVTLNDGTDVEVKTINNGQVIETDKILNPEQLNEAIKKAEGTAQAEGAATPPQPEPPKPVLERNELGQITKGIAQDTNKNGKAGRPCLFCQNKDEIQMKTQQYLDRCMGKNGSKPTIPYIEEIALDLNTIDDVLREWSNKTTPTGELEHPEFNRTYAQIKALQKLRLKQRTMGRYNPTGAIFLLKANHGEVETSKQIIAGDKDEPLKIEVVEAVNPLKKDE